MGLKHLSSNGADSVATSSTLCLSLHLEGKRKAWPEVNDDASMVMERWDMSWQMLVGTRLLRALNAWVKPLNPVL